MQFDKKKSEEIAQFLLGMSFKMGARGEHNQIDCYGVLCVYYRQFGIKLPDYSIEEDWDTREELYLANYASMMRKLGEDEKPEVGDMVLFRGVEGSANHAGIYLSGGRFIHSFHKVGTRISKLTDRIKVKDKMKTWRDQVYAFFRMKD